LYAYFICRIIEPFSKVQGDFVAGKLNLSKTEVEVEVTCVQSAIGIILKTISAGGTGFDGSGLWGDTRAGQICSVSDCRHVIDWIIIINALAVS
jgi:hypothetical protein